MDDGILLSSNEEAKDSLLLKLKQEFEIKIDPEPETYLGMELKISDEGITTKYAQHVLETYKMADCNSTVIPRNHMIKLNSKKRRN